VSSHYPSSVVLDIYSLAPGELIELFEIDLSKVTKQDKDVFYFHSGTSVIGSSIVWQEVEYVSFPIEITGFEYNGKGKLPSPMLKIANITGILVSLLREHEDLLGAKVTRHRTFAKYLDPLCVRNDNGAVAVGIHNETDCTQLMLQEPFEAHTWHPNESADPTASFPDDIYYIDRKKQENRIVIEFELSTAFDVHGVKLPRRQMISNTCTWEYGPDSINRTGSAEGCSWLRNNDKMFDSSDQPVTDSTKDVCGKRVGSCELRFGETEILPYGGFPGSNVGF